MFSLEVINEMLLVRHSVPESGCGSGYGVGYKYLLSVAVARCSDKSSR